jgi:hypothetical protein
VNCATDTEGEALLHDHCPLACLTRIGDILAAAKLLEALRARPGWDWLKSTRRLAEGSGGGQASQVDGEPSGTQRPGRGDLPSRLQIDGLEATRANSGATAGVDG